MCVCVPQDLERPGILEGVKSSVCENIALYAQKYDEDFQQHLPTFVTSVWNLLTTTNMEIKYDVVGSIACWPRA